MIWNQKNWKDMRVSVTVSMFGRVVIVADSAHFLSTRWNSWISFCFPTLDYYFRNLDIIFFHNRKIPEDNGLDLYPSPLIYQTCGRSQNSSHDLCLTSTTRVVLWRLRNLDVIQKLRYLKVPETYKQQQLPSIFSHVGSGEGGVYADHTPTQWR